MAKNVFLRWWRYLFGKRDELADLELKDALLAKVVLDIHRLRSSKVRRMVPLRQLFRIHRLDRDNAIVG